MSEGDICYIRQGLYHETIFIDNISGSEGSHYFCKLLNEKVVLDGTKPLIHYGCYIQIIFGRPQLILTFGNCLWIGLK